jgi:hypothetical protein
MITNAEEHSWSNGRCVLCNATKDKKASGGFVGHGIYELGERGTETVLTAE